MSKKRQWPSVIAAAVLVIAGIGLIVVRMLAAAMSPTVVIGVTFGLIGVGYGIIRRSLRSYLSDLNEQRPKLSNLENVRPGVTSETVGKVSIYRVPGYADEFRAYSVIVDGERIGSVDPGQTAVIQLPCGEHRISLKIDWAGSNTLTIRVSPDGQETLKVSSNLRGFRLILAPWYLLFSPKSYLRLGSLDDKC